MHDRPMNSAAREVTPDEYWPLTSTYLRDERKKESWHINRIEWDGEVLRASARLEGCIPSVTDGSRSHLSIFSAREMDAQFAIIGIHLKMRLARKTSEVWLLRCEEECMRAITNLEDVRFEMRISTRVTSSGKIFIERECVITDDLGGEIRLRTKALMPQPYAE